MAAKAIIAASISALASVAGGISAAQARREEADNLRDQGILANQEAQIEAARLEAENKALRKKRAMAFIKNGVTLDGSPLFLIEEQKKEDTAQSAAIRNRGFAQGRLAFKKAKVSESTGRAEFIGGIGQAAGTVALGLK